MNKILKPLQDFGLFNADIYLSINLTMVALYEIDLYKLLCKLARSSFPSGRIHFN